MRLTVSVSVSVLVLVLVLPNEWMNVRMNERACVCLIWLLAVNLHQTHSYINKWIQQLNYYYYYYYHYNLYYIMSITISISISISLKFNRFEAGSGSVTVWAEREKRKWNEGTNSASLLLRNVKLFSGQTLEKIRLEPFNVRVWSSFSFSFSLSI